MIFARAGRYRRRISWQADGARPPNQYLPMASKSISITGSFVSVSTENLIKPNSESLNNSLKNVLLVTFL